MGWIPWRYWNIVEFVELPGKAGMSETTGMSGMSCKTHGCISRRSPCLLCVEFLFWNEGPLPSVCSTRRALCLLYVESDSGWRILWIVV